MAKQAYIALVQIGGSGDKEIWRPGTLIELDDDKAALHLAAGNVAAINDTVPPKPPASDTIIHEPELVKAPAKKTKGGE